jgi:hypothetical protein
MTGPAFSETFPPNLLPGQKNVAFKNLDPKTLSLASSTCNIEYFDLTSQSSPADLSTLSKELKRLIHDESPSPTIDMTKTYMVVVLNYPGFDQGTPIRDLISSQRIFSETQNKEELLGIMPTQSIYYKESEVDAGFEAEGMQAV